MDGDAHAVRGREGGTAARTDETGRESEYVLAQRHIYLSDDPGEPVVHHPAGTIRDLLPGLEHRDESAPPLRGRPGQQFHRTDQARDVHVVSARVHDPVHL